MNIILTQQLKSLFLLLILVTVFYSCSKDDDNDNESEDVNDDEETVDCESVYFLNTDSTACTIDIEDELGVTSFYEETITGTTRSITVNNIPPHNVGEFPNDQNPNAITELEETYEMTTEPVIATERHSVIELSETELWISAVLFSGMCIEVTTTEYFENTDTGYVNYSWNVAALQKVFDLGFDCNNAHVQTDGRYHTHAIPTSYIDYLEYEEGSEMIKIGYAADGFPIYYKYGYDDNGDLVAFESGYTLKEGDRGGDGVTAPAGCYDGIFMQDYEFTGGTGLDECNGRTGKTPESDSEYYYVLTENWPSAPICFSGTPNESFNSLAN